MANLVLVSGTPAAGKTTLARTLARQLGWPVLLKDAYKEALFDTLGYSDPAWSSRLSVAAYASLFTTVEALLDANVSAVIEGNFKRGQHEVALLPFVRRAPSVLVHVACSRAEVVRRYGDRESGRVTDRHPGHLDAHQLEETLRHIDADAYAPLGLELPSLAVDTSEGYVPSLADVIAFIRASHSS